MSWIIRDFFLVLYNGVVGVPGGGSERKRKRFVLLDLRERKGLWEKRFGSLLWCLFAINNDHWIKSYLCIRGHRIALPLSLVQLAPSPRAPPDHNIKAKNALLFGLSGTVLPKPNQTKPMAPFLHFSCSMIQNKRLIIKIIKTPKHKEIR